MEIEWEGGSRRLLKAAVSQRKGSQVVLLVELVVLHGHNLIMINNLINTIAIPDLRLFHQPFLGRIILYLIPLGIDDDSLSAIKAGVFPPLPILLLLRYLIVHSNPYPAASP